MEIFDLNGNRIAMEKGYPGLEDLSHSRSRLRGLPVSREYVFKATVDEKVEENSLVEIRNPYGAVDISVHGLKNDIPKGVYVHMEVVQVE
jgi:hypothetical protein